MEERFCFNYFTHFNVQPNARGWFILRKDGGPGIFLAKAPNMVFRQS
jgi:hypothetical protein